MSETVDLHALGVLMRQMQGELRSLGIKLDLLGFGLLGITFGSLEFILDKGQEDDWFSSGIITFFAVAMVIAFVTMISATLPDVSASISFMSFMASTMQSTWPFFTTVPTSTKGGESGDGAR